MPWFGRRVVLGALALGLAAGGCGEDEAWTAAWATGLLANEGAPVFDGETVRQSVVVTAAGERIRLRLSNRYGSAPLAFASVRVALADSPSVARAGSDRAVRFAGDPGVTIPAGYTATSDDVEFAVQPGDRLLVSVYSAGPADGSTWHQFALTRHAVAAGDQTAREALTAARAVTSTYWLAGVEVAPAGDQQVVVAFGDSITDGVGSTVGALRRYPDRLFARLQADPGTRSFAVVNQGIGGNRLLRDDIGPSATSRFERDVLDVPGVSHVLVLIGINDIRYAASLGPSDGVTPEGMIAGLRSLADRARAQGVRSYVGTILPFGGTPAPYYSEEGEATRQAVNAWIRGNDAFDGVVDFEAVVRDPAAPTRLLAAFDSGDHLHPSDAGYAAMAAAVPLSIFGD